MTTTLTAPMVQITATVESGIAVSITNGRHVWGADEPIDAGGFDDAPTPYELLVGSLAACTAITLKLYAGHKGIEVERISAEYSFDRVYAEDCAECESEEKGLLERIKSRVIISGPLTDAQRARLAEIVRRCPVHKSLEKGIKIFDEVSFE